jgi:hypothetical protein
VVVGLSREFDVVGQLKEHTGLGNWATTTGIGVD